MPGQIELAAMQNNLMLAAYEVSNGVVMRGSFSLLHSAHGRRIKWTNQKSLLIAWTLQSSWR